VADGDTDDLISSLEASVREAVSGKKIAVAFSGGLDSGVLALLSKKYADVTLYTVGAEGAYDVRAAEEIAKLLKLPWIHLTISEDILEKEIPEMIRITGTVNPITISFEVPLYMVLKHSSENIVLSGQGADELFAGYSKYIGLNEVEFADALKKDMMQLLNVTLAHEKAVADNFEKKVVYPYLDERVMRSADRIEVPSDDNRKPMLRDAAVTLGCPELAEKRKKAAQYGSGTMVTMRSMAKKRKITVREMILSMNESVKER